MARVTVEDSLENVGNRFDLVLIASKRARNISMGAEPMLPADNDKPTVIALREIADGLVGEEILNEAAPAPAPMADASEIGGANDMSDAPLPGGAGMPGAEAPSSLTPPAEPAPFATEPPRSDFQ